jgi:hypothetical protein
MMMMVFKVEDPAQQRLRRVPSVAALSEASSRRRDEELWMLRPRLKNNINKHHHHYGHQWNGIHKNSNSRRRNSNNSTFRLDP